MEQINKYAIDIYHREEVQKLKTDWHRLENGKDMTYFQSYDWTMNVFRAAPKDNFFYESIVASVKDIKTNRVVLVAPLFIIKHRYRIIRGPKVRFLNSEWNDYSNFVYDDFYEDALVTLLDYICSVYNVHKFCFDRIQEKSLVYLFLTNHYALEYNRLANHCVQINQTGNEFFSTLSKSTRQNIRTAKNRMLTDGIEYSICFDNNSISREEIYALKLKRNEYRYAINKKSIKNYIKELLDWITSIRWKDTNPILFANNIHFLTIHSGENLMAFFAYGLTHKKYYIVAAGMDEQYNRYSPGIVAAYEFCANVFSGKTGGVFVDFTRGEEPYKYELGGVQHNTRSVCFII